MGDLLSVEKIQLFLTFAVPGIIILYFRSQFLTGKLPPVSEGILSYATLSLIYHALILGVDGTIYENRSITTYTKVAWILLVFVIPAAIGILSGLNAKKGWTAKLLSKLRINTVHPVDCAWDWHFGSCEESWIRVVLKDGTLWAGILGEKSFISSDPKERDLYLERVYSVDEQNNWTEKSSAVWIAQGEVQSIEMWPKS